MAGYVDIGINPQTNDIAHEGGLVSFVNKEDETIQRIRTCLRRIQGEWFLDISAGIPYFGGQILGSRDIEYAKLIIREALLEIEGVKKVAKINIIIDKTTKKATVYAEIEIKESVYKITEEL